MEECQANVYLQKGGIVKIKRQSELTRQCHLLLFDTNSKLKILFFFQDEEKLYFRAKATFCISLLNISNFSCGVRVQTDF